MYTRNGVRRSDGARSIDGIAIGPGEDVVIVDFANGIATVQRWREFVGDASPASRRLVTRDDSIEVDSDDSRDGRSR
jgi:hypothetical protein